MVHGVDCALQNTDMFWSESLNMWNGQQVPHEHHLRPFFWFSWYHDSRRILLNCILAGMTITSSSINFVIVVGLSVQVTWDIDIMVADWKNWLEFLVIWGKPLCPSFLVHFYGIMLYLLVRISILDNWVYFIVVDVRCKKGGHAVIFNLG